MKWAETAQINRIEEGLDHKIGIITSSTSYQYVKEVFGDKYPVLKLGMIWPEEIGDMRKERGYDSPGKGIQTLWGASGAG